MPDYLEVVFNIDDITRRLNERVSYYFTNKEDSDGKYFDGTTFKKFIEKKFLYGGGFYDWNGLRYFLYEYEMEKVRERRSAKIDWKIIY